VGEDLDLPDELFGFGSWLLWLLATRATPVVDRVFAKGPARPSRKYGMVDGHPVPTPSLVAWLVTAAEAGREPETLVQRDAWLDERQKVLRTLIGRAVDGEPRLFKPEWLRQLGRICELGEAELDLLARSRDGDGYPVDPAALRTAIARTLRTRPVRTRPGPETAAVLRCQESPAGSAGLHGFPAALSSFVGRSGPVRKVTALLTEHRLVTVTGPGGTGKTRLASEVARRAAVDYADGVWLVELAKLQDPALVAEAVATALGVSEQPGVPAAEAVARVMARQQLLLVIDNCEHVIAAAAELCAGLLTACDDLRVLATSREPLGVTGEARYRLAPLGLPDPADLAVAAEAEAVVLFADRARSADARFTMTGETTRAVARLVTRLDGMPLAIELAAARVEALGVEQLLSRIDDRFALLASGARNAPARQQSLAAAVEWSYQLLDEEERRVFRSLAVFPAAFTLEAAEAVAGTGAGAVVLRLVDRSLVIPPRAGADGRPRYQMLDTLRAYGAQVLAQAGEAGASAAALVSWAVEVAERAATGLQSSMAEEQDAAQWLDAEEPALRQALTWALAEAPATAARLAGALGWWWWLRGRLPAEYGLLREIAARAEAGSEAWCWAQTWLALAADHSGDTAAGVAYYTALCCAVAGQEPTPVLAGALADRAIGLAVLGRPDEAAEGARRALAMARQVSFPAAEVNALCALSCAATYGGDLDAAVQLARQAAQVTVGVPGVVVRWCLTYLVSALIEAGDLPGAAGVCSAGLARSRDAGDVVNQYSLLPVMVVLDVQAGRLQEAAVHLREALQLAERTGAALLESFNACGFVCAATGRPAEAVTIWAASDALTRENGISGDPEWARLRDQPVRAARQLLGHDEASAAEERGAAMSLSAAAEYALMLAPGSDAPPAGPPSALAGLTVRERELVAFVACGRTDAEIAAELSVSNRTVSSRVRRIRDKTGCRRRADLIGLALAAGLV
jgi:predicted ATPase/DNA-binding CsgD family transcriptional regulator